MAYETYQPYEKGQTHGTDNPFESDQSPDGFISRSHTFGEIDAPERVHFQDHGDPFNDTRALDRSHNRVLSIDSFSTLQSRSSDYEKDFLERDFEKDFVKDFEKAYHEDRGFTNLPLGESREYLNLIPPTAPLNITKSDHSPPPLRMDGGLRAWLQVLCSFLMAMNSFGYVSSFALFQAHWTQSLNKSSLDIAWVGSISLWLIYFLGTISGPLMDRGYVRLVTVAGCSFQIIGILATSFSTKYWHLILAQGLLQGIGNGLMFTPSIGLVSTYFAKKRGLALAFTACGGPVGGIIFPLIARQLKDTIGYPWTIRVMCIVVLVNSVLIHILIRPRTFPNKGPLIDFSAFKDPAYSFFTVGVFFTFWGLYVAYFYVSTYGKKVVHIKDNESLVLLMVLNTGGIPGRILPSWLADKYFGAFNTVLPCLLATGVMLFGWVGIKQHYTFYLFAIIYGIFANATQTLIPTTLTRLTNDMSKVGSMVGMVFTVGSFACLTGPPIAGTLIDLADQNYHYAQYFSGVTVVVGFCYLALSRWHWNP